MLSASVNFKARHISQFRFHLNSA